MVDGFEEVVFYSCYVNADHGTYTMSYSVPKELIKMFGIADEYAEATSADVSIEFSEARIDPALVSSVTVEPLKREGGTSKVLALLDVNPPYEVIDRLIKIAEVKQYPVEYNTSKERIADILARYVDNDLVSAETSYVREVLRDVCGMTDEEAKDLGFDYLFKMDE